MASTPAVIRQVELTVPGWNGMKLTALHTPDGVYFPLKLLCFVLLGDVSDRAQRARVQRDRILRELSRTYPVETSGGRQSMVCIERLGLGRWMNGLDIDRFRPELQERFLALQWDITRAADRLFFGEVDAEPVRTAIVPPSRTITFTEEQLVAFLDFLARRIGNVEIDLQQLKIWQMALLSAPEPEED